MSHKLIVVHTTAGAMQANIIKGMLEAAGIPATLSQESAGATFGLTVGAMGMVDVLVPEEHVAEAEELLAAMSQGKLDDSDSTIDPKGLQDP
ncbi:MAG: DUF2007 domain-containing protein [Anaerolineales bacterium]